MAKYNFEDMDVNLSHLEAAISGDNSELVCAFWWNETPQGADYWQEQYDDTSDLDRGELNRIRHDYLEWRKEPIEEAGFISVRQDAVNSPSHYGNGEIECIVYMKDNMDPQMFQGYLEGNAKKYLHRWRYKGNGTEDLKKARWYLDRLIKELDS